MKKIVNSKSLFAKITAVAMMLMSALIINVTTFATPNTVAAKKAESKTATTWVIPSNVESQQLIVPGPDVKQNWVTPAKVSSQPAAMKDAMAVRKITAEDHFGTDNNSGQKDVAITVGIPINKDIAADMNTAKAKENAGTNSSGATTAKMAVNVTDSQYATDTSQNQANNDASNSDVTQSGISTS